MKEKDNIAEIDKELEGFSKLKSLKGKNSFSVPESYFDNLENDIMSKIAKEFAPAPKIRMNTKQLLFYVAAASIIALFVFIVLRSGNQDANKNPIANQPNETIVPKKNIANNEDQLIDKNIDKKRNDTTIQRVESINKNVVAIEDNRTPINKVSNPEDNSIQKNPKYDKPAEENNSDNYEIAKNNQDYNNSQPSYNQNGQAVSAGMNYGVNSNNYSPALARKAVQKDLYLGEDLCSNKPVLLNASIQDFDNLNYQWSTGDTTSHILARKSGIYWVKIYDFKNNLLGSDTIKVNIVAKPKPNLGEDKSICNYESILISSACKNTNFDYKWSINDNNTPEIYLSDLEPGIYEIELQVRTCADTAVSTMTLRVKDCNIKIPNVITPNGDGRNDRFVIKGLEHYPGSQLHILDRNGRIVYESMDYQNDWDASNLTKGTYFYRLQLNDAKKTEKNGTLSIIR